MERAFAAAHCDWRVLTVEVSPESFPVALAGMQAMQFAAIRFFPGLQHLAAQLLNSGSTQETLDSPSQPDGITSAMLSGNAWTSWDNIGFGILKLVQQHVDLPSTVIWLHGNSRLTRSTLAALKTFEKLPAHVVCDAWLAATGQPLTLSTPPTNAQQEPVTQSNSALPQSADAPQNSTAHADSNAQQSTESSLPDWATYQSPTDLGSRLQELLSVAESPLHLIVIGDAISDQLATLRELQVAGKTLVLASNELLPRNEVSEAWPSGDIIILSESEQAIASEAYDFERWASQPADLDLFRDAFDEYADF
jgi:hypothetical protein